MKPWLWQLSSKLCSSRSKLLSGTNRQFRGEEICKKDDFVDFFGIICHGTAHIPFTDANNKELGIGSMLGLMNFTELSQEEKHSVTVIAKTDGLVALIPFGEEKVEFRRNGT